jgi:hypothetical protein
VLYELGEPGQLVPRSRWRVCGFCFISVLTFNFTFTYQMEMEMDDGQIKQDAIRIPSAGSSQKRAGSRVCTGEVYPNPAPPSAGARGGSLAGHGPAARSEGPAAAILAAVRPLGPVRSWAGLDVVRGVQLGPWAAGFGGR